MSRLISRYLVSIVSKVKVPKYLLEAYFTHYIRDSTSGNQRITSLPVHIKSWKLHNTHENCNTNKCLHFISIVTSVHAWAFGMEERLVCANRLVSVTNRFQTSSVKYLQKRLSVVVLSSNGTL